MYIYVLTIHLQPDIQQQRVIDELAADVWRGNDDAAGGAIFRAKTWMGADVSGRTVQALLQALLQNETVQILYMQNLGDWVRSCMVVMCALLITPCSFAAHAWV